MEWSTFASKAQAAGASLELAKLIFENFAAKPHTHAADEVIADPEDGETQAQFNDRVSDALSELGEVEGEDEEEA